MIRSLVLFTGLATAACASGPMTPCVTTETTSCVDQADQTGKHVAAAVVIGIALVALVKIAVEVTPLGLALHGHHG